MKRALMMCAVLLVGGCSGSTEESPTVASTDALSQTSDATQALELAGLTEGVFSPMGPGGPEATRCDADPDIQWQAVCSKQFPRVAHFAWTNCEGRGRDHRGPPPLLPDGGLPPPPDGGFPFGPPPRDGDHMGLPPDGGCPFGPPHDGDHMGPPPDGGLFGGPGGHGGPGGGVSSGTVDINTAVAPVGGACVDGAALEFVDSASFDITRSRPDGNSAEVTGTVQSSAVRDPAATVSTRTSTIDTTRILRDSSGTELRRVQLTGTTTETFDRSGATPVRTLQGSLAAVVDGQNGTLEITGVQRPPPPVCFWPTAGSVKLTLGAEVHELVFSSTCGTATLDGASVTLEVPHGGPNGAQGGMGGHPPRP